jgi:hypothetical protein
VDSLGRCLYVNRMANESPTITHINEGRRQQRQVWGALVLFGTESRPPIAAGGRYIGAPHLVISDGRIAMICEVDERVRDAAVSRNG